jgi:L-iditol 2-dehydrogenase
VPKINVEQGVYKLPDWVSFEEGTFVEPLACVVRGQRLAALHQDDTLLIIGGGLAGLLHAQLAREKGIGHIIVAGVNQYRLKLAEKFGAHRTIDGRLDIPQELKKINDEHLADQVILCKGTASAALTALECVDKGGTILFFAVPDPTVKIPMPITEFWRNEVTLKTSYGAAPNDLEESLTLLAQRKLNIRDMITHRFGIQQTAEGFKLMAKSGQSLKIIIEPNRM